MNITIKKVRTMDAFGREGVEVEVEVDNTITGQRTLILSEGDSIETPFAGRGGFVRRVGRSQAIEDATMRA